MKILNKVIIICFFAANVGSYASSYAQSFGLHNGLQTNLLNQSKPQLSVSFTSSFMSFGSNFNSFGTTIMPQVSIPISQKISLQAGVGYTTLFMGGGSQSMFQSAPAGYGHVFVSGTYQVNEKLSIRGTGYKTFSLSQTIPNADANIIGYDYSSQGVVMDVEYKVTDKFRINIGFEYREQNTPYFYQDGIYQHSRSFNPVTPFSGFNNNSLAPF